VPFKSLAIALLVPPTSLLFVALAGLLIEWRFRRVGRTLVWIGVLGLLILAMPAVGNSLLVALERDLPLTPPADQPPQAIVILGGDIQRGQIQAPVLHLGLLSLERVRAGAILARRTRLPILVTGGKLRETDPPIAALMADSLAHDFQVPARWIEAASRDTWENAHLSATILRDQGIRSIYLVTNGWHMRRAIVAFADSGITVTAAPTRLDRVPTPLVGDFIPDVGGWRSSYYAMHEWIGWAWYSLR
jgi:uncharacterized SAM-binding protein YcdF (DUF218 family)